MSYVIDSLRYIRNTAKCLPARILSTFGLKHSPGHPVRFIIENANWAIRTVGENIRDEINKIHSDTVTVTVTPAGSLNSVVHFASQYMWQTWGKATGGTNKYVVSFFHGKHEDGPEVSQHIDQFLKTVPRLSRIVASNSLVHERLISWGVPSEKIVRIPIGVNTDLFTSPNDQQRKEARAKFNIPKDAIVIGSFQKDGVGWGDGMEPKLIKGPDIFVETLKELAKDRPVFAMLTGPARGFVKSRLEDFGIPYAHAYPDAHADLVECYHTLDLYIVSSREEGGPMGLMESMSSHIPVVSTNVGMAPDLIEDGVTGGLDLTITPEGLASKAREILSPSVDRSALTKSAREAVMVCDWSVVGKRHYEEVYLPLMAENI